MVKKEVDVLAKFAEKIIKDVKKVHHKKVVRITKQDVKRVNDGLKQEFKLNERVRLGDQRNATGKSKDYECRH